MDIVGGLLLLAGAAGFFAAIVLLVIGIPKARLHVRKWGLVTLLASFGGCAVAVAIIPNGEPEMKTRSDSAPVEDQASAAPVSDRIELASWRVDYSDFLKFDNTLMFESGVMIVATRYSDGSGGRKKVAERPWGTPGERRFDLEPDSDRSEYVILSANGLVTHFGWDGARDHSTKATFLHAGAMTIGLNPTEKDCVPKALSPSSREIVQLYEELQGFKDGPEFSRMGFAVAGPYHSWLQTVKTLHANSGIAAYEELNFTAGDLMTLGLAYVKVGTSDTQYIEQMERTIQAGLALANCRELPVPQ